MRSTLGLRLDPALLEQLKRDRQRKPKRLISTSDMLRALTTIRRDARDKESVLVESGSSAVDASTDKQDPQIFRRGVPISLVDDEQEQEGGIRWEMQFDLDSHESPDEIAEIFQAVSAFANLSLELGEPKNDENRSDEVDTSEELRANEIRVSRIRYGSPLTIELLEQVQNAGPWVALVTAIAAIKAEFGKNIEESYLVNLALILFSPKVRDAFVESRIRHYDKIEEKSEPLADTGSDPKTYSEQETRLQLVVGPMTQEEARDAIVSNVKDAKTRRKIISELPNLDPILNRGFKLRRRGHGTHSDV